MTTLPPQPRVSPPARSLPFLAEHPVTVLESLTDQKAEALADLGIVTVLDLLTYYPYRHHDRRRQARLADLKVGEEAWVEVAIRSGRVPPRRGRGRGGSRAEFTVADPSGTLAVTFFNQPWRVKQLPAGSRALLFGKLTLFGGRRQFANPTVDLAGDPDRRLVAMYRSSEKAGITSREFEGWITEALDRAGVIVDPLPEELRAEHDLVTRSEAFRQYHRPDEIEEKDSARRRLAFDELFRLQLEVGIRRRALERDARGIRHLVDPHGGTGDLVSAFVAGLPFPLTGAQARAIAEIGTDLAGPLPMHRLLQGDVGAGKTVVALAALLVAVQGGHQGALMAPTEVLAEQHHLAVRSLLEGLTLPDDTTLEGSRPVRVVLLTGRTPAAERRRLLAELAGSGIDIVIGTHALLTGDVTFADLGAVVIDEQHRFGVEQRATLRAKGREGTAGADPDLLVMTATPIPRTAAMVVFGDLDVTELDELPAGRAPVETVWARGPLEEEGVWERVRSEVAAGHRAYVVCPLVEGSERIQATSATEEYDRLRAEVLPELRLGLLHGQMKPAEKEVVMADFRTGKVQVLVATTVIEVGVDVPEATVMVVEDAERFGIAQLHQLRGRVGRSTLPSWCHLLSVAAEDAGPTDPVAVRLRALERTTDGFELADVDLELRGEGSILGSRQKGRSDLKLASLRRGDRPLVLEAREVAEGLLEGDPRLEAQPLLAREIRLFVGEEEAAFLLKS